MLHVDLHCCRDDHVTIGLYCCRDNYVKCRPLLFVLHIDLYCCRDDRIAYTPVLLHS